MNRVHLKRQLKAVLLADVVGYSRLMSVDEEGTHVKLADYVENLIKPQIAEYGWSNLTARQMRYVAGWICRIALSSGIVGPIAITK